MKKLLSFADNRTVYSWALYDWANSAYATTVIAAVLPTYYSKVAAGNLAPNIASSYWAYSTTIAMLLLVFMAPVLGAIADYKRSKLKFLFGFVVMGVTFTGLLYFIQEGDWLLASIFYILSRVGWSGANVMYDSFLPHIARNDEINQVSTLGYALGYLGGALLLALNLAMILSPHTFGITDTEMGTRLALLSVACWWALFSIPLFRTIREPAFDSAFIEKKNTFIIAFQRLSKTIKEMRNFRQAFLFLIAFWFYNDGIGTIIGMAVIFLFMMIYYGVSGFFADIAVIVNMGFIIAIMTMLEGTLTMPGIAGMILTIGMAVDANVIIFERIRENLRLGKTVRTAVDGGFSRALVTILDANITTLITALVLYQFGTGPIKGFAVTLSIGIIGSMFASIILVKAIFDGFITNIARNKLSI